jgi:hypothetical protein
MTKTHMFGLSLIAVITAIVMNSAQTQQAPEYSYPPLSHSRWQYYQQHPEEFQQLLTRMPAVSHTLVPGKLLAPGEVPAGGTWTSLSHPLAPTTNLMNPRLLTNGTVIAHVSCSSLWYKFTPDNTGSYINGTWAAIASMSGYGPRFFGSGVLPDGRVIIEGGEYNGSGCGARTTKGAIYDPVANSWTSVNPPIGWGTISDAGGIVLPNGAYMQTSCCDNPAHAALLNPSTLTWTSTGSGKFDPYDEEAMALLPGGTVLTVDAYTQTGTCGKGSEQYNPATGGWSSTGNVSNQQADCNSNFPSFEVGPLVMRPNGTAVSFSGLTTGTAGTSIYNTSNGTWSAGANIPLVLGVPYTLADAPAAVLPNGNILFAASPGNWTQSEQFPGPTHWFEMSIADNSITQVADKSDAASFGAWEANLLVLPTGQIMAFTIDGPTVQIYTPAGTFQSSWQPSVSSVPSCVLPGTTYVASGTHWSNNGQVRASALISWAVVDRCCRKSRPVASSAQLSNPDGKLFESILRCQSAF